MRNLFLLVVCISTLIVGCKNEAEDISKKNILPPHIYVLDQLYKGGTKYISQEEFNNMKTEIVELGSIKSTVDVSQLPTENFQSNAGKIGGKIFSKDNNQVIYSKENEKYWIYYPVDKE